ncbi:hypothetical protein [Hymenobacter latericus]|uniref:hypothetical protein n=1 Tax=Hymenobacter sp. YIM 151858-1 TaxID=2987688 RepID=UPI002227AD2C|nr:hypothetical protein [Hymenobacter sp. YIM 151858-1]UYZ60107.1 hypothetical protein OIS50_04725 [Hymenobacter sp. YIM 151858-1]
MTKETLQQAKELDQRIGKLHAEIADLQQPNLVLRIHHNDFGFSLMSTIGTSESSEHPDAELARAFVEQLIKRRQQESVKLHERFNTI